MDAPTARKHMKTQAICLEYMNEKIYRKIREAIAELEDEITVDVPAYLFYTIKEQFENKQYNVTYMIKNSWTRTVRISWEETEK